MGVGSVMGSLIARKKKIMMARKPSPSPLPPEYQRVSWLGSDGTQYFWTDVSIQDGLTVDARQMAIGDQNSYLFGGASGSGLNTIYFNGTTYNSGSLKHTLKGQYKNSGYNRYNTLLYNTLYRIVSTYKNGYIIIYLNDVEIQNTQYFIGAISDAQEKCVCFGVRGTDGSVINLYKGRLYSLTVSKDDTVLANNEPGMYDTVTDTFYINEGTGEFTVGPNN